jgi:glycosyltransferase involved in cell wall biosynthesis
MMVNKICFLSAMHPARDKRVFDKEAVYLAREGFSVSHLCPGEIRESGVVEGVKIITYPPPVGIKGRVKQLFKLYHLAKIENADAYHCNEVDSWVVGVLLKIFCKKYCVFDVHEHYPSAFAQSRFPRSLQPVVYHCVLLMYRLLTPFTDRIVLAKQSVSDDFKVDLSKKILVRNYVPLSKLNYQSEDLKTSKDMTNFTLVHVGLLTKTRGWPQILDGLHAMQNKKLRFVAIGDISDGTREEFKQRVIDLNLSDRVELLDWMLFEDAFSHIVNADIGIIAFQPGILNHVYAMPHKMFDYMAAELAVLLPYFAVEVAPIIEEKKCGLLFNPADPLDIANKLDYLLDNPDLMYNMGTLGKKAVLEQYNWEAEFIRLSDIYKSFGVVTTN